LQQVGDAAQCRGHDDNTLACVERFGHTLAYDVPVTGLRDRAAAKLQNAP